MKTNILVQYQGGGYDGCFWEWNYFFIDKNGDFHNIYSSGRAGITTKQDGQNLIAKNETHTYIYDLTNKKDIETFSKECNPVNITGVLQWFEDNPQDGIEFFILCLECGGRLYSCEDTILENWHGCGGIMSTADLLLCYECYTIGECSCCESYVGEENIVKVDPDEHYGLDYICVDCKEYHDEEREEQVFKDIRFKSFCTGKPDMFSGKMREKRLENPGGCV